MDALAYPPRSMSAYDGPSRGAIWVWIALVAVTAAVLSWQIWPRPHQGHPDDIDGRPPTVDEATAITDVIQHVNSATGNARWTGDISRLTDVFADDPSYPLFGEWATAWKQQEHDSEQLLAVAGWPLPKRPGLLTYTAAESLRIHRDGPPYWAGASNPIRVYDIEIDGEHAGAKSRLSEGGGTILHYILTRGSNGWRVSAIWTTCAPGGCA
jgi:hypothetical protein